MQIVDTYTQHDLDNAGAMFDDMEMATICGLGLGGLTLAGAAAVGSIVIPGQVVGGLVTAGTLVAAGQVKKETGSYFPFLGKNDTTPAVAVTSGSVTDTQGNAVDVAGL